MSEIIQYRPLEHRHCERIREIDASQYIGRAWRKVEDKLQLVDINYLDPDFPEGFENHLHRLQQTVSGSGLAIGAFDNDGRMIGFSAVNLTPFGQMHQYVLLDQLFISLECRKKGFGRNLFLLTALEVKKRDIPKIYICAGSSEETIAFYRALGCTDAVEINTEFYNNDPRDLQLEYTV